MIKKITFSDINNMPDEWAYNVPGITLYKNKSINFTEGVNVLVGPNGSGKSTIIRTIAKYYFCWDTGLTKFTNSAARDLINSYNDCMLKDGMKIISDGCVSYMGEKLFNGNTDIERSFGMDFEGFKEVYNLKNSSTGETSCRSFTQSLDKIYEFDFHNNLKTIVERKFSNWETTKLGIIYLKNGYNNLKRYIKKDNSYRRPTILIDEVDSHMDILNTIYGTKILVEQVSKFFQIIIATHNPLIYTFDNINFIELEKDYNNKIQKELLQFGIKMNL